MISIIIPAHNESSVIQRTLAALTTGSAGVEMEVLVVCNGCTDDTAAKARACGPGIRVLETDIASKVHALNLGDATAIGFPRFYVDADVLLSASAVQCMADRLVQGDVLAVSPQVRLDLTNASWAVHAFYAIDQRLPSARETIGGSGVYGLSEEGRRRFSQFPSVTGDDAFVRRTFKPAERCVMEGCFSTVTPPKRLAGVIAIKTRSHFGNYELARKFPQMTRNVGHDNRPALVRLAFQPWLWLQLVVYGYVKVVARLRARRQIRSGSGIRWERDDTSRGMACGGEDAAVLSKGSAK